MRLTFKLSTTVAAVLGVSLLLGCRQPTTTSSATSAVTEPASPTAEASAPAVLALQRY